MRPFVCFAILAILATPTVSTAAVGAEPLQGQPLWEAGLGVGGLSLPDYVGSDQRHSYLLPIPYLVYRGDMLRINRDQVRGLLYRGERAEVDVSLGAAVPVKSDENDARAGMPNLDPTFEIGPQWSYRLRDNQFQATIRLPLRRVIAVDFPHTRGIGWVFAPSLALDRHDHPRAGWHSSVSTGPTFADQAYHSYYYTVAAADANTHRPAYAARAGYGGWNVTATVGKSEGSLWLGAFVRGQFLGGASFLDSPLVRSRTAWQAGIGLAWTFAVSEQRVGAVPLP